MEERKKNIASGGQVGRKIFSDSKLFSDGDLIRWLCVCVCSVKNRYAIWNFQSVSSGYLWFFFQIWEFMSESFVFIFLARAGRDYAHK